jgi:hypothetical protein
MKRKLKQRKHNLHRTLSAPGPKPRKTQREAVTAMARAGLVEDQIASRLGVDKNKLRAQHIDDIKEGKRDAAAADAEAVITKEEYYFLDSASSSFAEDGWSDPQLGNLLFPGMHGEGARNLADAFARWKMDGGKWMTTGLSGKFNLEKYAEFAKVVSAYRQNLKLHEE